MVAGAGLVVGPSTALRLAQDDRVVAGNAGVLRYAQDDGEKRATTKATATTAARANTGVSPLRFASVEMTEWWRHCFRWVSSRRLCRRSGGGRGRPGVRRWWGLWR
jgi:hypothetical protein